MKRIFIGLLACFINSSCLEKIGDKYDSDYPVLIRLINRDALDFAEITIIGKKDSLGLTVAGFTSTLKSGVYFNPTKQDTVDIGYYNDKLSKAVGGVFEVRVKTIDQNIIQKEFGKIEINAPRKEYILEVRNSQITQIK